MPNLEAPGFYERAKFTAAGRADDFLKSIEPDFYEAETSSVECPIGHVALVKIDRDMIAQYVSREGDPWMSEARNFEPGWYIVRSDDNGLVWGLGYGPLDSVFNEESARADFAEAEEAYAIWSGDDEGW
jgi:hypothetical protein